MFRKDGKVWFHWRDPEHDPNNRWWNGEINECLDGDEMCTLVTFSATRRVLKMIDPGAFDGEVWTWSAFIGDRSRMWREVSYGGLSSRFLDEDGKPEYDVSLEFFWFEDQIYFLRFVEASCTLLKITSENPDQDWQWLYETLARET